MGPIRNPLGAIGAILVALEGVAGGSLVALESGSALQTWMVGSMIFVIVSVTHVVLGTIIYFAVSNSAYLFSPSDISESAHLNLYGGNLIPPLSVEVRSQVEHIDIPQFNPDIHPFSPVEGGPDSAAEE